MTLRERVLKRQSERGSALVLTLLFILLLTTMSTGMYLYSSKQSIFANGEYTSVAAGYVAEAGLEAGKSILARQDMIIDVQGNNNGIIDRDDFPFVLSHEAGVGRYDLQSDGVTRKTDNKQGVGTYSLTINAAFSENVELEFDLFRNPLVLSNLAYPTLAQAEPLLPRTMSFKHLQIAIREESEIINAFDIDAANSNFILNGQGAGTTRYEPFYINNTMNPNAGKPFFLEMNAERFSFPKFRDIPRGSRFDEFDFFDNRLVIFPNEHSGNGNVSFLPHAAGNSVDKKMQWFQFDIDGTREEAIYILKVTNNWYPQLSVKLHFNVTGTPPNPPPQEVISATDWTVGPDAYVVLDFNSGGNEGAWNTVVSPHPMVDLGPFGAGNIHFAIAVEFDSGIVNPTQNISLTVSRGVNDPIELGYRMRSETMVNETSNCWYPQWPDCTGGIASEPILSLDDGTDDTAVRDSAELTQTIQRLGRRENIRVDELYTILSTGNVEEANKQRQLLLTPSSYLEYSLFYHPDSYLHIGTNTVWGGQIYSSKRIQIGVPTGSGSVVDFFEDVVCSGSFDDSNPESADFHGEATLFSNAPVKELPGLEILTDFYQLTNSGNSGWRTPSSPAPDVWLFLGPYDYVEQPSTVEYGFSFDSGVAEYIQPDAGFPDEFKPYPGWTVPSPLTMSSMPAPFNGVILVDGDLHVWGKLHGRSLTIMAKGDIYIEREIVMGTDDLDIYAPYNSTGEGQPVHLGLIACEQTYQNTIRGDIIITEHCPRIMRVESALLAPGGHWLVEDTDFSSGTGSYADIDTDESHLFHYPRWNGNKVVWTMVPNSSLPVYDPAHPNMNDQFSLDINRDGRLTDGDITTHPDDPAHLDLGTWDETTIDQSDYVWHLTMVGPIIMDGVGDPGPYLARGAGTLFRTRGYRYDPTIKTNPPPFFPVPENAIEAVEWSNDIVELQNE